MITIAVYILFLFFPLFAWANAGWPGLWIVASSASAYIKFWYLILASLIIEGWIIKRCAHLSSLKTAGIVLLANGVSALVGVGLSLKIIFLDAILERWGVSGLLMFFIDTAIVFVVSVLIEFAVVRSYWKAPWMKIVSVVSVSNIATHALGVWFFYSLF